MMDQARPSPSPAGLPAPPQSRLRSRFADDPEMAEIVGMFSAEMPGKVAELRACWDKRDLDRLMRLAHQLKGASGGYGYPEISEAAGRLEGSLRSVVGDGAAVSVAQLQAQFTQLIELCRSASGE